MAIMGANIVYPVPGSTYPISVPGPAPAPGGAYFTASFSATCPGGPQTVSWGFDGTVIGNAQVFDQVTIQFVWNLPEGPHVFSVDAAGCGSDNVQFFIA